MSYQNLTNKNNLPKWSYNNKLINSISEIVLKDYNHINPDLYYGFVYKLTYTDNSYYIGRKVFYETKEKPSTNKKTKRNIIATKIHIKNCKKIKYDIIKQESNWYKYTGSHGFIESKTLKEREIVAIALSKLHLTFLENKFLYNNLFNPNCLNENISGKLFKNVIIEQINEVIGKNYD